MRGTSAAQPAYQDSSPQMRVRIWRRSDRRANGSRPMAEVMHLQQVAMDARDGFRFVRAARQVDRRAEGSSLLGRSGV
jgi:hypothetical protein